MFASERIPSARISTVAADFVSPPNVGSPPCLHDRLGRHRRTIRVAGPPSGTEARCISTFCGWAEATDGWTSSRQGPAAFSPPATTYAARYLPPDGSCWVDGTTSMPSNDRGASASPHRNQSRRLPFRSMRSRGSRPRRNACTDRDRKVRRRPCSQGRRRPGTRDPRRSARSFCRSIRRASTAPPGGTGTPQADSARPGSKFDSCRAS